MNNRKEQNNFDSSKQNKRKRKLVKSNKLHETICITNILFEKSGLQQYYCQSQYFLI